MRTKLRNWEVNSPATHRPVFVAEMIKADGSLPPDLAHKPLESVAYYLKTGGLKTLTADTAIPIALGDIVDHCGISYVVKKVSGNRFWAEETL